MKANTTPYRSQIKLFFIVALFALVGTAFISSLSPDNTYSDDFTRIQVVEIESVDSDAEPSPQEDPTFVAILLNGPLATSTAFASYASIINQVSKQLTFQHQTRPRAPPLF